MPPISMAQAPVSLSTSSCLPRNTAQGPLSPRGTNVTATGLRAIIRWQGSAGRDAAARVPTRIIKKLADYSGRANRCNLIPLISLDPPHGRAARGQWHKISRTFIQDGSEMHKQLPDLYAALRAQELPPDGAHALYIAGRRCGWATRRGRRAARRRPCRNGPRQRADRRGHDPRPRAGRGAGTGRDTVARCQLPARLARRTAGRGRRRRQAGRDGAHRAAALRPADQGRAPERLDARRPAVGGAPRPEQINGSRYVGHPGRRTGRQRRRPGSRAGARVWRGSRPGRTGPDQPHAAAHHPAHPPPPARGLSGRRRADQHLRAGGRRQPRQPRRRGDGNPRHRSGRGGAPAGRRRVHAGSGLVIAEDILRRQAAGEIPA